MCYLWENNATHISRHISRIGWVFFVYFDCIWNIRSTLELTSLDKTLINHLGAGFPFGNLKLSRLRFWHNVSSWFHVHVLYTFLLCFLPNSFFPPNNNNHFLCCGPGLGPGAYPQAGRVGKQTGKAISFSSSFLSFLNVNIFFILCFTAKCYMLPPSHLSVPH